MTAPHYLSSVWDVFVLFLIPIGGGIPAGVVLAQARGIAWPMMCLLYFISDVVLACVFEPLLVLFVVLSRRSTKLSKVREAFGKAMDQTIARYGVSPGPFTLVMITFGTDPMTGRSVALAAGHGMITGWALTIMGDMLFFLVLMVSTIWLNGILGDGTTTAIIIMVAMMVVPAVIRRIRQRYWGEPGQALPKP